jgi:SdrD B-like domain
MHKILPAFRRRADFLLSKLYRKSLYALYFVSFISSFSINAQVSGRIYKDYNANGVWDSTATYLDQGRLGTVVQVYDKKGILKGSTTTDANGKYFIPNVSGDLRLQVTLPAYYTDGFITSINKHSQSNVQFIKAPAINVDLGMNFGDDYCGTDPKMIVACYSVGIGGQSEDAIVSMPYSASGVNPSLKSMMNSPIQQMGSVWGGAYL